MKTDKSIKSIVTAAIRRHSIDIESWVWTRLWDNGESSVLATLSKACEFAGGELPILYSYIDLDNWTVFSSRAVWYADAGKRGTIRLTGIASCKLGFFKGAGSHPVERLAIQGSDGVMHHCPYHTGKTSMGPVYAINTLRQIVAAA